jgi:hypothetical protein
MRCFWCKFSVRPNRFLSALHRSGRKHGVPESERGLARGVQTTQVELAFADAMQQLDAGNRDGRAFEDLEADNALLIVAIALLVERAEAIASLLHLRLRVIGES